MTIITSGQRVLLLATSGRDRISLRRMLDHSTELNHPDIRTHAELGTALEWTLRESWIPELVALAAGYPQAWSENELADLWNSLPLARWIIIQDGWSRSALRHLPWLPAGCCVPRERFAVRLKQEISTLKGRHAPLPLTASLDETFLRDAEIASGKSLSGLAAGIFTPDRHLRTWLRELLEMAGASIVPLDQQPAAVVWDLDPWNEDRKTQLDIYRRREAGCLIVGLRNTVHEMSTFDAEQHGVDSLLPKQLGASMILERLATC